MLNELSNYDIETGKDGRVRAYDRIQKRVVSYPRLIMENYLNRRLLKTEDVHHKDGNPLNNEIDNLEVLDHKEHDRMHALSNSEFLNQKYFDKEMICPVCKKIFIWTRNQQASYYSRTRRTEQTRKYERQPPCCSKVCAGKYAASIQYAKHFDKNKVVPQKRICPICKKEFTWSQASQYRFRNGQNETTEPCCSRECIHALRKLLGLKNKKN